MGRFNGNPCEGSTSPRNRGRCAHSDCPTGHRNSCRKSSACSWKRITNLSGVTTHTDFDLDGEATPHCERYGPSGQAQSGSWRAIYRAALTRRITSCSCPSCVKASTMSSSSPSSADYGSAGYLEDCKFNTTLSGVPQGGIVSPVLSRCIIFEHSKTSPRTLVVTNRPGFAKWLRVAGKPWSSVERVTRTPTRDAL